MKIIICTSTKNVDKYTLIKYIRKMMRENNNPKIKYYEFPEFVSYHPDLLLEQMVQTIKNRIDDNEDTYVITWSNIIFKAIHSVLSQYEDKNIIVKCHQFNDDGTITIANFKL